MQEADFFRTLRNAGVHDEVLSELSQQLMAFGRAHYEFSRLIRWQTSLVCQRRDVLRAAGASAANEQAVLRALLESTAGRSVPAALKLCRAAFSHGHEDQEIAEALSDEFLALNAERNHLAHGDVALGLGVPDAWRTEARPLGAPRTFVSVQRISAQSSVTLLEELSSIAGLNGLADRIAHHRRRLAEYAWICLVLPLTSPEVSWLSPSSQFLVKDGRAARRVPYPPETEIQIFA